MIVYVVVYSNYSPSEVDSIWTTKDRAEEWVETLKETSTDDDWHVEEWHVSE